MYCMRIAFWRELRNFPHYEQDASKHKICAKPYQLADMNRYHIAPGPRSAVPGGFGGQANLANLSGRLPAQAVDDDPYPARHKFGLEASEDVVPACSTQSCPDGRGMHRRLPLRCPRGYRA